MPKKKAPRKPVFIKAVRDLINGTHEVRKKTPAKAKKAPVKCKPKTSKKSKKK